MDGRRWLRRAARSLTPPGPWKRVFDKTLPPRAAKRKE